MDGDRERMDDGAVAARRAPIPVAAKVLMCVALLSCLVVPVVAPGRVPSVGEWAGIRAMKFLKVRTKPHSSTK